MTKKNLQDNLVRVNCAYCHKPFHFAPEEKAEAKQTGAIEVALECPFCQKQNIVEVPAKLASKDVIFRGGKSHKA